MLRFPDLALAGKNQGKSDRGRRGLMTSFLGWRQAFKSAVMMRDHSQLSAGPVRTMNCTRLILQYVLAGTAVGAMTLASPALSADLPVKALQFRPAFDWSGFYIGGHTGYGRGASSAVLTDPAIAASSGSFGGVIGGVQAGYNVRLPSGLLLGVEADLTFPNYLASNSIVSRLTTARSDVFEQWDYVGTLRSRIGYANGPCSLTPPVGWPCRRAVCQFARGRRRGKRHPPPARLGRRRRAGIRLCPALERQTRISLQPVRTRQHSFSLGRANQFDARLPTDSHRPQPQGRLAGVEQLEAQERLEDRSDRS